VRADRDRLISYWENNMKKLSRSATRRVRGALLTGACGFAALSANALRADYVSTVTATGPKAWYRFEDANTGHGAVALDSASGINGQYVSYMAQANGPAGIGGKAGAFDGIDSYVDTLAANEAQFDFIGTSFTFEAWVQVGALTKEWQAIAAKGDDSWRVARNALNNWPSFAANGLAGEPAAFTPIDDGKWHHIVAVVDTATMTKKEYVDGVMNPAVQAFTTTIANSANPLFIGENSQARGRYWNGAIDEVAIYDKALTDAQILAHFQAGGGVQDGSTLPAPVLGAPVTTPAPGPAEGNFGVRVVRAPYTVSGTAGAIAALADPNLLFERYITDAHSTTINFNDPEDAGGGYSIPTPKTPLPGNRPGGENGIALQAKGTILIEEAGEYTFGIDGDDGTRLTIGGATFTKQAGGGNATGNVLEFPGDTGDAFTLGSTFLTAGEHQVELIWNENGGGAFVELFAAKGIKAAVDTSFAAVGAPEESYTGGIVPTVPAGFSVVERIKLPEGSAQILSLADARALLDNPLSGEDAEYTGTVSTINFNDPEGAGISRFPGDVPFLNDEGLGANDNDFAMRANGTLVVATAGTYTFGFNSDDGASLTVEGGEFNAITAGGGGIAEIVNDGQTIEYDALTGDSFTLATMSLEPGEYSLEFLMFERDGGGAAELYVGAGVRNAFDPTFVLLGTQSLSPDVFIAGGLKLVGPPLVEGQDGDTNGDGTVDLDDLNAVRNNFGATGTPGSTPGDAFPFDGVVDLDDLNGVRNNFGAGPSNSVPEPSSFALIGLGLAGLFGLRRFRNKK
jgi:hypothetical protein